MNEVKDVIDNAAKHGRVKWFYDDKGYGFLIPEGGGEDVFVHMREVKSDVRRLDREQKVTYTEIVNDDGRFAAENVYVIEDGDHYSGYA